MPDSEPDIAPNSDTLIRSKLLASVGVCALFTTRLGGESHPPFDSFNLGHGIGDDEKAVAANMQRLVGAANLPSPPHQARQEHGTGHLLCSGSGCVHDSAADILIAQESGCPLAVRTADCLPILLADPVNRKIAAVHAGWRGTAARVVVRAVELMREEGAAIDCIRASLGPCIGPCCFEIGEEPAAALAASATHAARAISRSEKAYADLAAINAMQLHEAGVATAHIESLQQCTCCHPELFFSYRRDGGSSGRHLAVVALGEAH